MNALQAEVAQLLTQAGQPAKVLGGAVIVGQQRAVTLFESAYDEHAYRLARLDQSVGAGLPKV